MWNLYKKEKFLEPLVFSNGKTQDDIVDEVLETIHSGEKIIFIRGVCGTGKSAIALNIAKNLGKTSIIVPGKNLQNQYKRDYETDKYLLKNDGSRLKISVITGRNNHACKFLEDNDIGIPKIKREINSKLNDIFDSVEKPKPEDKSADNLEIPCKIEIKEKNFGKLREYLKQNNNVNIKNINKINDVKRLPVASVCPYWSPVLPEKYELKNGSYQNKKEYLGLNNIKFTIYQRKPGCKFYEQFNSYVDSDVIIFNSLKYQLESALNRKPLTEVEIIDECDEFLDSFTNQRSINIDKFQNSLIQMATESESSLKVIEEMYEIINHLRKDRRINEAVYSKKIIPLKNTGLYDLFRIFLESDDFLKEIDEESYISDVEETAIMFKDFFDETYLDFNKKENNLIINLVTTNLAKKFRGMVEKNKVLVLMSGTIHSDKVLKNIFGLDNFKIIEAETQQQGAISVIRTGMETDCKYENFSNGKLSREHYLKSLDKCLETAKKPVLVHVSAFSDLPSENEKQKFDFKNLISKEELMKMQSEDKSNKLVEDFKKGKTDVIFTTRCSRGIDFPGKECNSIVFTKFPNPNPEDAFWKILKETKPMHYWEMYKDKARRELLQKIYRGLRFREDHVYLLSPDTRVLEFFEK
ncbi:MAG: helicase C-terminal domain-containing protein [Nanoarchaeota archaeon]